MYSRQPRRCLSPRRAPRQPRAAQPPGDPKSGSPARACLCCSVRARPRHGAFKLPFKLNVYGNPYSHVRVSSNGNMQFGIGNGGSTAFSNDPLPSADFAGPTLMPFWDDLYMVPSDTSHFFREGIYTQTSGTAPHRTFIISRQGHAFNNESYLVLAEAIFTEGSSTIRFRYGTDDCQGTFLPSETIGAQASGTWTQIVFNPPCSGLVSSGTQFT